MSKFYNYKTTLLSLFIKSMGEGFSKLICEHWIYSKKMSPNNFKQKMAKMSSGDYKTYREILYSLENCVESFTKAIFTVYSDNNTNVLTDTSFCPECGSDKYFFNFREVFHIFKCGDYIDTDFFYESFENALSYFIAKSFYGEKSCEDYIIEINNEEAISILKTKEYKYNQGRISKEEYDSERKEIPQLFRSEYNTSLMDVRYNKKENKTFFKWVIDEFYSHIKTESKADEIIKHIFGENDGSISTTFEKLKYESGKRNWRIFKKLFKNEHNDKELMGLLASYDDLASYQIFQSRMFVAYFLENLCTELPNFVGEDNTIELKKIITGNKNRKQPEDFLIENHKEKTEAYKNKVIELFDGISYEKLSDKLDNLDKNCPATETIKAYVSLLNSGFYYYLEKGVISPDSFAKNLEICKENPRFLEYFANMGSRISIGKFFITSSLNGFLWTSDD